MDEDLTEIRNEILTEMYAEAEPPLDFMEALERGDEMEDGWYENHVLSMERQRAIFDEHTEGSNLSDDEVSALSWSCILNLGPRSTPK